jgi:hypothetical protein
MCVVEPLGSVERFDAREIALEHEPIEGRVLVDDAAEEPEEFRGLGGRDLVLDVARIDLIRATDLHGVDRRAPLGNRLAADECDRDDRENAAL